VVTTAVVGSLLLGAATIRAAGEWTAASAPLAAPPVTVESLTAQLEEERARGAALAAQLGAVAGQTSELQAALGTAGERVNEDAKTATQLEDRIAAAKKRLAALNKSIAAARRAAAAAAASARTVVVVRKVQPAATPKPHHDDEGDDD
jgi:chromosome segregation ATPase